ncbi:hypothetical protein PVK06_026590 [Gossypium arboreum]|uniref:Uncharacterized protein n=1 Tax=Gossypium arboreum TaxID=29729 RepID=A0ABR0NYE3_GOSAR|nr:hypothetical protein PVK06_026590 [Gossypium arboreum]
MHDPPCTLSSQFKNKISLAKLMLHRLYAMGNIQQRETPLTYLQQLRSPDPVQVILSYSFLLKSFLEPGDSTRNLYFS